LTIAVRAIEDSECHKKIKINVKSSRKIYSSFKKINCLKLHRFTCNDRLYELCFWGITDDAILIYLVLKHYHTQITQSRTIIYKHPFVSSVTYTYHKYLKIWSCTLYKQYHSQFTTVHACVWMFTTRSHTRLFTTVYNKWHS